MRDTALAWSGREDVFGSGQIASMTEHPSVNSISWPWGWRLRHLVYTTRRAHIFVCRNDYYIISFCNYKNDAGILFRAILQYGENGVLPELEPNLALLWPLIQQRLDHDWDRYQHTVIKRKYAAYSRWEKQHDRQPIPYSQWVEAKGYEQSLETEMDALA